RAAPALVLAPCGPDGARVVGADRIFHGAAAELSRLATFGRLAILALNLFVFCSSFMGSDRGTARKAKYLVQRQNNENCETNPISAGVGGRGQAWGNTACRPSCCQAIGAPHFSAA